MRAALLSLQSHGDRSFLDDSVLALLSGDLRAAGFDNDLVVCVLDPRDAEAFERDWARLVEALLPFDVVVYERVWDAALVDRLRGDLSAPRFVQLTGEHVLDDAPADYLVRGDLRRATPALFEYLSGQREQLPSEAAVRGAGGFQFGASTIERRRDEPRVYAPNLRPIVVNPEALPEERSFSIEGNTGCPYQADARDNPLYTGAAIPAGYGRGCAFCTTGNHYEAASPTATIDKVFEQLSYVRATAPELSTLVLRDQNPAIYLADLLERCASEGVGGFILLLETRADWFLRNRSRFERALELAADVDVAISPFLIGIENFSQAELDRFNKGTTVADNIEFLEQLWLWDDRFPALDLSHASFGFVLLTPWTTMEDLRVNLEAVERTRLDRLRGQLLLSRARLYPDTALYYLAKRDGLLIGEHASVEDDASARYGYFPSQPWRFADPAVAQLAELAAVLTRRLGGRDELALWRSLLDTFDDASEDEQVAAEQVLRRYERGSLPDEARLRDRFGKLVAPLSLSEAFAEGWRFGELVVAPGRLRAQLLHDTEPTVQLEIGVGGRGPAIARSKHYAMRWIGDGVLSRAQQRAVRTVCDAIEQNDR